MSISKVIRGGSAVDLVIRRGSIKPGSLLVALLASAALLGGCGGSSTPTHTKAAATKEPVSAPAATSAPGAPAATSTPSASTKTPSFADASNCAQLDGVGSKFAQAMKAATSGGSLNYQEAVKAYQQLADAAPSAIRPDLETMASAFSTFAEAISKSGYTPGKTPSASEVVGLEKAATALESSKLESAEKNVEAWAVKNCS